MAMLRLSRIFKNYDETGSLSEQINLYGFIGPHVFLTKSGEVGVILEVRGVDYECLDTASIDGFTKRLESALKLFDENYRLYQYLFKRNNETIPYKLYDNPIVDTAIKNRIAYLGSKADTLFSLSVYYVVLFQGFQTSAKLGSVLAEFPKNPKKALSDLRAHFSGQKQTVVLGRHVNNAQAALLQKARSFILQVSDFLAVRMLDKQEAFRVLKRTLNFHPDKLELAKLKYDTFLDYYLPESPLECHRGHLRVDDYYVKVFDPQGTFRPEFSAHLQAPARSRSELLRRYGMEKGRFGQDASCYPDQAPPFPQHQALVRQPSQLERREPAGCVGRRFQGIPGPGTRRRHCGDRAARELLWPVFAHRGDLRPRHGQSGSGVRRLL
jgi:hypothetical protein